MDIENIVCPCCKHYGTAKFHEEMEGLYWCVCGNCGIVFVANPELLNKVPPKEHTEKYTGRIVFINCDNEEE